MTAEYKQTHNLYDVYNQELDRLHKLLNYYLLQPQPPAYTGSFSNNGAGTLYGGAYGGMPTTGTFYSTEAGQVYSRIVMMEDILIQALKTHEPLIQEKIAELALTGKAE
jgi:hypothetical protein